jgi:hypothetical protein
MAGRKDDPERHAHRRSMLRVGAYIDPIAVVGVTLSIVVSVVLDLTDAATGVESFLACLMGITLSLVLDSTVRAERRHRIRQMIDAAPWLGEVLVPLATATTDVERRYAGTPIATEARNQYARLGEQLHDLAEGRIVRPRSDYEHLLQSTLHCRRTMQAVTNVLAERPDRGLGWWTGDIGRRYWQANRRALENGVRIERVFVYTTMTAELDRLIGEQMDAGVHVTVVQAAALDPALWHNLAIWDGTSAWEARLNAGGEIVGNIFTMNKSELARLTATFETCAAAAQPRYVAVKPAR